MNRKFWIGVLIAMARAAMAQSINGLWDARIKFTDVEIPFRLELAADGTKATGWFFNGDVKLPSTSGKFENGSLVLNFDYYAAKLEATVKDGEIHGQYGPVSKKIYPFEAKRFVAPAVSKDSVPKIGGLWEIPVESPKGEKAWRLIVKQTGADVSAAILRVDGDTGALTGTWQNGRFVLSHFSASRPALLVLTPAPDGGLGVELTVLRGRTQYQAIRPEVARSKGLPEPTDPSKHTSVKDPLEPFQFSFPDLNGKVVSNTDVKFRDKVVLVNISGSWCPNCHDEAPFLASLYREFRKEGLEVVALSFEDAEQLKDPARLRAFIKQYGIEYSVLLGGEPEDLKQKLTQAVNLNSWPTTFFLGRDGKVRFVHAGFPGPGSGELHRQAKEEFVGEVKQLLAENRTSSR